jgi:hypothetical protein
MNIVENCRRKTREKFVGQYLKKVIKTMKI